jgi:paraquat-inducible protein B
MYAAELQQTNAPAAETRSFWSRFWWLLPLLLIVIIVPLMLRSCDNTGVADLPQHIGQLAGLVRLN